MAMGLTLKMGEGIQIGDDIEIFYTKNKGKNTIGVLIFSKRTKEQLQIERIESNESKMGFKPRTLFELFRLPNDGANGEPSAEREPFSFTGSDTKPEGDGYS